MHAVLKELSKKAEEIVKAFECAGKLEKARTLADVVRAMRREQPDILEKLPKGIDNKNHHLWDVNVNGKPLRQVLKELRKAQYAHNTWRSFCETLGNEIYRRYKENTGGIAAKYRILGETLYYPEPEQAKSNQRGDNFIPITPKGSVIEWIFVGKLRAVTPFYFGVPSFDSAQDENKETKGGREKEGNGALEFTGNEQTSCRILLDKKGRYRIPRSLLRGVLRRDLRTAFGGSGCNVELGGMTPCMCHVCTIMRGITVMDTRSEYTEPPDIRYRIRLNPYTSVVDEGALFDMEVGPEGITFPFVLRYRGECLPYELSAVLHSWMDGKAWLGGSGSTGKGRFELLDLEVFAWDLKEGIESYIRERGRRGVEQEIGKIAEKEFPAGLKSDTLPDERELKPYRDYLEPLWTKVIYEMKISSPLISADTIAALLDGENRDCIMYEKRRICSATGKIETVPVVKGETVRGIFRTAVRKRTLGLDKNKLDMDNIDNHEDCTCDLCAIFGNEHEAGKVRFEDSTPEQFFQEGDGNIKHGQTSLSVPPARNELYKHIDHVAIDRFHSGAEDAMKFDVYPLAGSPGNPITLRGTLWIKNDLSDDSKKKIAHALADIGNGLYPIGGKTGVGYGWVSGLEFKIIQSPFDSAQGDAFAQGNGVPNKVDNTENEAESVTPDEAEKSNGIKKGRYPYPPLPELKPGHIYYPHYFLEPAKTVHREQEMIGHERFHPEHKGEALVSGKIVCKLKTHTPLIIPDIGDEKGRNENKNSAQVVTASAEEYRNTGETVTENTHKTYPFFRINNEVMIPGSEIRGMVSSVYETITNSCFRIFDETKYITRRLSPEKKDKTTDDKSRKNEQSQDVRKGLVKKTNEGFSIIEVEKYPMKTKEGTKLVDKVYRLPLYDNAAITTSIRYERYAGKDEKKNARMKDAIAWNTAIAEVAGKNIAFLKSLPSEELKKVLQGECSVRFNLREGKNPNDHLAELHKNGTTQGLLKFTGMNMVNIRNVKENDRDFHDDWDAERLNIFHNTHEMRNSLKKEYPRPVLKFIKDGVEYTIPKRCERIFVLPKGKANEYKVPNKVRDQYRNILNDYGRNFGHVHEKFLTRVQHKELTDGDLVYFIPDTDNKTVKSIMPVPLSRVTDSKTLGERLPQKDLLPCVHEVNEEILSGMPDFLDKRFFSIHPDGLCPACRLFGTTYYKGRVRFGFAHLANKSEKWLVNGEHDGGGYVTLPLLERPRPTWSMPSDKHNVPGRKFYVHHNGWQYIRDNQHTIQKTENNRTVEPLDESNAFIFDVYFENLRKWELGLLLYCLELEDGMGHKLGMGKPLGFGSVKIEVDRLLHFTVSEEGSSSTPRHASTSRHASTPHHASTPLSMTGRGWKPAERQIKDYVEMGLGKLKEWFGAEWHEIKHIKDMRSLLRISESNPTVKYPALNEKSEGCTAGYTYEKMADADVLPYTKRVENLTTPWTPCFPYQTQKKGEQATRTEARTATPPGQSAIRNNPVAKKLSGKVKRIEKDGRIVITKDDGKDIDVRDFKKTPIKEGQKIKFNIEPGGMYTGIFDIEIVG